MFYRDQSFSRLNIHDLCSGVFVCDAGRGFTGYTLSKLELFHQSYKRSHKHTHTNTEHAHTHTQTSERKIIKTRTAKRHTTLWRCLVRTSHTHTRASIQQTIKIKHTQRGPQSSTSTTGYKSTVEIYPKENVQRRFGCVRVSTTKDNATPPAVRRR